MFACLHKVEATQIIQSIIISQIQPLNNAISQERIERVHVISDMQTQIGDLRATFDLFSVNQVPMQRREDRGDEVIICGFCQKSKIEAMELVQQIIDGNSEDPFIIKEELIDESLVILNSRLNISP